MLTRSRMTIALLLGAVALAGSLALAAAPAGAATAHPAQAAAVHVVRAESAVLNSAELSPDTKGKILCSGDLCIQYDGSFANCSEAAVDAWADATTESGHFQIKIPSVGYAQNSSSGTWKAGGAGFEFATPLYPEPTGYTVIFWHNGNNIGQKNFTINTC
jgi:hypothetical protein